MLMFIASGAPALHELCTCTQAYNKDFYQRALLRRDWYLHREEETLSKWYNGEFLAANVQVHSHVADWQSACHACVTSNSGACFSLLCREMSAVR